MITVPPQRWDRAVDVGGTGAVSGGVIRLTMNHHMAEAGLGRHAAAHPARSIGG